MARGKETEYSQPFRFRLDIIERMRKLKIITDNSTIPEIRDAVEDLAKITIDGIARKK